jgi:hypothetical protein
MNLDALKAPPLFGGWKDRFFMRQRHLRHPTTGRPVPINPTAGKVNEELARVAGTLGITPFAAPPLAYA